MCMLNSRTAFNSLQYGVKLVVVGSDPKNVRGLARSPLGATQESGEISIAPEFAHYATSVKASLTLPSQGGMYVLMVLKSVV